MTERVCMAPLGKGECEEESNGIREDDEKVMKFPRWVLAD